jgi:hypothetical protein
MYLRYLRNWDIHKRNMWSLFDAVRSNSFVSYSELKTSRMNEWMGVNIYVVMLTTDRFQYWWLFEDVLSYTCLILKTQFIWANQAWWTSNNVIFSKLHTNVKIQPVFCVHSSQRKILNFFHPCISDRPKKSEVEFHNVVRKCF